MLKYDNFISLIYINDYIGILKDAKKIMENNGVYYLKLIIVIY